MGVISLLYYFFYWNNEEINIFAIFYQHKSREKEFKCFEGKLRQKVEEKIEEVDSSLSVRSHLVHSSGLTHEKAHNEAQRRA